MRSHRPIRALQAEQRDDPLIDVPWFILPATTLRKLPKLAPTAKIQKTTKNSEERSRMLSPRVNSSKTGP